MPNFFWFFTNIVNIVVKVPKRHVGVVVSVPSRVEVTTCTTTVPTVFTGSCVKMSLWNLIPLRVPDCSDTPYGGILRGHKLFVSTFLTLKTSIQPSSGHPFQNLPSFRSLITRKPRRKSIFRFYWEENYFLPTLFESSTWLNQSKISQIDLV